MTGPLSASVLHLPCRDREQQVLVIAVTMFTRASFHADFFMSWTDVFPVLTDDHIEDYESLATESERRLLDEYFGVARVENPRQGPHLVATSLFWKPANAAELDLPSPDRVILQEAGGKGRSSRHAPWEHYVQPLLAGAAILREARPEVVLRVYLAADLEFLMEDLVNSGCEVMLMKSSSLRHNPGAMWRFLAYEEEGRQITITDADHAPEVLHNIERTEQTLAAGHGLWRAPYMLSGGGPDNDPGYYRPINACQFGGVGGFPVSLLMKSMVWHTLRGSMPDQCHIGGKGKPVSQTPIFGSEWPSYGFDEWFLMAALYPRMAMNGMLTFVGWNDRTANHWLALDIEYVTWANPRSEILYFAPTPLVDKLEILREAPSAESEVLDKKLAAKELENAAKRELSADPSAPPVTLVIARYKEKIRWLLDLPDSVTVVMYNKGPAILDQEVRRRIDHLVELPNSGREADTYLHHLANFSHGGPDEWTVFCQGDPFPHSPSFLKLLELRAHWAEVQPLTAGYVEQSNIPPVNLRVTQNGDWLGDIPVYTEYCSASTLDMNGWQDEGGRRIFKDYLQHHDLPRGWSISGHFLECCGLKKLAEQAWEAELLRFTYGAIFAVRNDRLGLIARDKIPTMRKLAQGHYSHGYVFEKMWMHLFGLPFIRVQRESLPVRRHCTPTAIA